MGGSEMRIVAIATGLAMLAFAAAGPSFAGVTSGSVWQNDFSNDASVIPGGPADSTFTTSGINYDSTVGGYTIGGFLNDPLGLNFSNSSIAGNSLDNTHFQFVGTVGLLAGNNSFVVAHDDGLILFIAGFGLVVNDPDPTSPVFTPFNVFNPGPAGNFAFQLDYNETFGPPATLVWTINDVVVGGGAPEPVTWSLMIMGFGAAGAMLRRRRSAIA
jgi:hypothetical protein